MSKKEEQKFSEQITQELNNPYGGISVAKSISQYRGSKIQQETYDTLEQEDRMYQAFIAKTYGSYQNFLTQNKLNQAIEVFDPGIHYIMDATIIKKDAAYKTDHLSAQEVILENLSGVCSVWFTKMDGSTRKLTCTLQPGFMPSTETNNRLGFFGPMRGDRIGAWDIIEGGWKSFYMSKVFRFVRDDTTGVE
jgi:hypothetical protein